MNDIIARPVTDVVVADGGSSPPAAPDEPRRELIWGGAAIAAFFLLFLGWAAFAPLDAGAYATGQVSVSGNRQAVQHRDGGIVSALNVREGDIVRRGQVLAEISGGELRATERGLTGQVLALIAQRQRLIAERDGQSVIAPAPEFAQLPADDQPLAEDAMRLQRQQFGARGAGRSTERGVLNQRIAQLDQQIAGYQRQISANEEQSRLIAEELEGMRRLADQGYAPLTRVRALERTAAQLEGEDGALRAQVARAREQIGEARLQLLQVGTTTSEEVAEQLRNIEVQLNELRPRLADARAQIARNTVRAPADGAVVGLTVFTEGGVIQPGQTLMEIVPAEARQVIVAQVSPTDADNVRAGQRTEVQFPGLREVNAPKLRGHVTRISADAITEERTGQSFFRVEIVVPEDELRRLGPAASAIGPGAPVEVIIKLRKRTALAYLLEPLTRSLWRSGSEQ